ncbi:MAG: hypothetical protein FD181_1868 [Prolixibacteraceae bacterium]|nr:MAG: hypothetical protein FD181_1868 [Prolixibacteraceae bacterium]
MKKEYEVSSIKNFVISYSLFDILDLKIIRQ